MSEQNKFLTPEPAKTERPYAKVLVVVILVLFFVTILAQFRSSFHGYDQRVTGVAALTPQERAQNQIDALKKADTDGDGLSDYDELYVYHTSPYIKDTDSDGIPDGVEIKNGTDPLCPEGKDCSINSVAVSVTSSSTAQATANTVPAATPNQTPPTTNAPAASQTQFTPAQIREALVANGVPQSQIDSLSDAELLQLLQQAQTETASQTPKQ